MTPAELPGYLRALRDRAAFAVIPAANAMGETYKRNVVAELTEQQHPRGTRTPSLPGEPPAAESGRLARSVFQIPASTPVIARTFVGPSLPPRDWVQEYGRPGITPVHAPRMIFYYSGWYAARVVNVPERSYLRSTRDHLIATGDLTRVAVQAFNAYLWG